MENILENVDSVIERENLSLMIDAIDEKVNNSDYTTLDLAAALLKLYMGMVQEEPEEEAVDFGDTGAEEPGMVRLFINIGKKQRVWKKKQRQRVKPMLCNWVSPYSHLMKSI